MFLGNLEHFFIFVKKYNVIALAIGFMIAKNLTTLTTSATDNIINPLLDPIIQKVDKNINFKQWELSYGPFNIKIGKFLSDLIEFVFLGITIVTLSKYGKKLI